MSVCGERRTLPSHGDSRTICFVRRAWRRGRGGDDMDYGVWGAGDRGGGTSSPSPLAPPPTAISPRSSTWGDPGETPDTAAHLISQALPPPGVGRGRSAAGAGGVGVPAETYGYLLPQARAGWGLPAEGYGYPLPQARVGEMPAEVRYLERGRQGRGNEFPLPVSPTPNGDIPTVQHMGRSWRRAGHGGLPAPPRIRLLP